MARKTFSGTGGMSLGFPPFQGPVRWIIIANVVVFFAVLLLSKTAPLAYMQLMPQVMLTPVLAVEHWKLWQLVTYGFLHAGVSHILWNMVGIWMFGATIQAEFGYRKFTEFYFWSLIGGGIMTIVVGYLGLGLVHAAPSIPLFQLFAGLMQTATLGASGALFGIFAAFLVYHGDDEIMLIPFPFMIKAKYIIWAWILIALAGAFGANGATGVAEFAHLGGALFGWLYIRLVPRGGLQFAMSESYYGARNSYYRWKRKQAAKKFEVYMRRHKREDFFDEYGNYKGHEGDKDNGDSRGPWVN